MKKIFNVFLALILTVVFSAPTFAAETSSISAKSITPDIYNVALNSKGIISISNKNSIRDLNSNNEIIPLSSISGYNNGNLTSSSKGFIVRVSADGIGGMGVTVKTSCPTWTNGTITFNLLGNNGSIPISNAKISSNGETKWSNLMHGSPAYFLADFSGIPSGHTVYAQVWIYG